MLLYKVLNRNKVKKKKKNLKLNYPFRYLMQC